VAGVFISYRRLDCAPHAGRLYDRLVDRLGNHAVFMDVDTIAPGVDFGASIEAAVGSCDVFMALIGDDWLNIEDPPGRRRLDDPNDLVRLEIAAALRRSDVLVIPVLVEGAAMPRPEQLPDDLKPLTRRNAFELGDSRWRLDVDRLIAHAEQALAPGSHTPPRGPDRDEPSASTTGLDAGHGLVPSRAAGSASTPARNPLGPMLLGVAIALVVIGGLAAVIIKVVGDDGGQGGGAPTTTADGKSTAGRNGGDDPAVIDRLTDKATNSAGGLTLSVVSIEQTQNTTRVGLAARNRTESALTLPVFNNCVLTSTDGTTLQADPQASTWPQSLPPGGDLMRGSVTFEGTLPGFARRASLSFAHVFGSLSGPASIKVSRIGLRRP
jgi:hypothetical protein